MQLISKCLFIFLLTTITTYALTCKQTYQTENFEVARIYLNGGASCCYQTNSPNELCYDLGKTILDAYLPTSGNWVVEVPRIWSCRADDSQDCKFKKL